MFMDKKHISDDGSSKSLTSGAEQSRQHARDDQTVETLSPSAPNNRRKKPKRTNKEHRPLAEIERERNPYEILLSELRKGSFTPIPSAKTDQVTTPLLVCDKPV
jgi:hypothetical protein